jgi:hypothetical protein
MSDEEHVDDILSGIRHGMAEVQGASALSLDRNRPYDGQPHTDQGERGKTLVAGLSMRDVSDCIVRGFLDAAGIEREVPIHDDIYNVELGEIDPGAVIQSAMCHVERMMGIFPNVPQLVGGGTKVSAILTRIGLRDIRAEAEMTANTHGTASGWRRAWLRLADAADALDAKMARTTVPNPEPAPADDEGVAAVTEEGDGVPEDDHGEHPDRPGYRGRKEE